MWYKNLQKLGFNSLSVAVFCPKSPVVVVKSTGPPAYVAGTVLIVTAHQRLTFAFIQRRPKDIRLSGLALGNVVAKCLCIARQLMLMGN